MFASHTLPSMDRKKPLPQASSDTDENTSSEEDYETGDEQRFVRSDRKAQESGFKEEENGDDDDGTEEESASERSPDEARSDSDSDASSASEGKSRKPANQFVVESRRPGDGKKTAVAQKSLKQGTKAEPSPKKGKIEVSKRDRDAEPEEKGSSKKLKKGKAEKSSKAEHIPKPKDSEKVGKDKHTPAHTGDKKSEQKKAITAAENPKSSSSQQHPAKRSENGSAKKAPKVEKGKNDKKAFKSPEPESKKEPFSPSKPKLWTAKDEIALSTEVLQDIKLGTEIPVKKSDDFWSKLFGKLEGKMEGEWTKEQVCDKVRRMKTRYITMAEKVRESEKPFKFRNSTDQDLFGLWTQIWGNDDVIKVDNDKEGDEGKDKRSKPMVSASPVKGSKLARDKQISSTTAVLEVKVMHDKELGARKGKQSEKQSRETDEADSDESDDVADSQGKKLRMTPMEVDQKDACANAVSTLVPKVTAVQVEGNNTPSHSLSDGQRLFQDEIRASLSELQECSKKMLKEWQTKATAVVENAVKAAADQSRLVNGLGGGGLAGLNFTPFRRLDLMDLQPPQGEQAFQQQWHELHLQELDVYHQRLELMQRECQLKQDQLKLQLHGSK